MRQEHPSARRQRWEQLCRRCGICCYEKHYTTRGLSIDFRAPCRYLDEKSRLCTVYEQRFRLCPECRRMTIFQALFSLYLPASCGYVQKFRIWRRFSSPPLRS
mgnify:CR=1 FL=1